MSNVIINRMNQRFIDDKENKDTYEIIGSEIKFQRSKKKLTQEAVAKDICSLSYLCKIETSQIEPNNDYLKEICKRLELSDQKIDALLNSKDLLNKAVNAFLENDKEELTNCYNMTFEFENYRCQIIRFIYEIGLLNFQEANDCYQNLLPIVNTMREYDFIVFTLFSAIFQYYNFRFSEAIELLSLLGKYTLSFDLDLLRDFYLYKCAFAKNNVETVSLYYKLKIKTLDNGYLELYDEIRYIICLYYLKNNCMELLKDESNRLLRDYYKNTINVLSDFKTKNVSKIPSYGDNISEMAKMVKLYTFNIGKFSEAVKKKDFLIYNYDFDLIFLLTLSYKGEKDYSKKIFSEIIPKVGYSEDKFIKDFVMEEVYSLQDENSIIERSKTVIRAHNLIYGLCKIDNESSSKESCYDKIRKRF